MANSLTGKIGIIYPKQTIASKNGGNPIIKREFVIRAIRFNPDDGTPELSERNTPILEIQGEDRVGVLDGFKVGDIVKVNIVVEGRSVKNQDGSFKFFNSVRATRIEKLNVTLDDNQQAQSPAQTPQPTSTVQQVAAPAPESQQSGGDSDLPF